MSENKAEKGGYICKKCNRVNDRGIFCSFKCEFEYRKEQDEHVYINWHSVESARTEKSGARGS